MAALYRCIRNVAAHRRPFALVSGLAGSIRPAHRLVSGEERLPLLGLYLRELGPSTLSNYKQP